MTNRGVCLKCTNITVDCLQSLLFIQMSEKCESNNVLRNRRSW